MKRFLFLICCLSLLVVSSYARSAYQSLNIESYEDYNYRRSSADREQSSYRTYSGSKDYVDCCFKRNNGETAYCLTSGGRIYDYFKNDGRTGKYFVGEEVYYKGYAVYIRWDDGAEQKAILKYGDRTDGRPKFKIDYGYSSYIFNPL